MKKGLIIIIVSVAVLLIIQLFRIDTTHPEIMVSKDYLTMTQAPPEINKLITNSCYDCHSFKTSFPWYSGIAPISWMIKNHVREGREHISFSEWGNYSSEKQISLQEECIEELEQHEMPLRSYTMIHNDARLSDDARSSLIQWFTLQIHSDTMKTGK